MIPQHTPTVVSLEQLEQVRAKLAQKQAAAAVPEKQAQSADVPAEQPKPEAPALPGKSLIPTLNKLLSAEFTAIHQYGAEYALAKNRGFNKLAEEIKERLDDERKHADMLMYRIIFLGGTPIVDTKPESQVGATVQQFFELDMTAELGAVKDNNAAVAEAAAAGDNVTRGMLESILKDEDDHVDEISTEQDKIELMGLGQYLATKV